MKLTSFYHVLFIKCCFVPGKFQNSCRLSLKKSAIVLTNSSTYTEITVHCFTDSSTTLCHCHVITGTWSLQIRHIYHFFPDGSPCTAGSVKKEMIDYGGRVWRLQFSGSWRRAVWLVETKNSEETAVSIIRTALSLTTDNTFEQNSVGNWSLGRRSVFRSSINCQDQVRNP